MNINELRVGDLVRFTLAEIRDPTDRYKWVTHWTHVEVVKISVAANRVTIRLFHYPQLRARTVHPERLWY